MTCEAVIAKLAYVLGKGFKGKDVKKEMLKNLRGEVSTGKSLTETEGFQSTLMYKKIAESIPDSLNSVSEMIQPIITHSAVSEGNLDVLNELKKKGINIDSKGISGRSALHVAVMKNDVKTVEFLLNQENVDINPIDDEGNSPLFYSCLNGNESITGMLSFKEAKFI
jgi:hypothetical protein